MATANPFDILIDDDAEDPNQLIALAKIKIDKEKKQAPVKAEAKSQRIAALPTKPPAPAQAVKEARKDGSRVAAKADIALGDTEGSNVKTVSWNNDVQGTGWDDGAYESGWDKSGYGGWNEGTYGDTKTDNTLQVEPRADFGRGTSRGRGRGRGYGRGRGNMFNRDANEMNFGKGDDYSAGNMQDGGIQRTFERRGGYASARGGFRGGRRGAFSNGYIAEGAEPPRRVFDRRSGTGRGNEFKREGAGRGNWGTTADEITAETEEPVLENENGYTDLSVLKDADETKPDALMEEPEKETEPKEPEKIEMTLEEYEQILAEKKKALPTVQPEERKVEVDEEFRSMQPIFGKKEAGDVFIKLGSEREKRKVSSDKEHVQKKSLNITEFLKPATGSYGRGRGRGRGRGQRGGFARDFSEGDSSGSNYPGGAHYEAEQFTIDDHCQFPSLVGGK